MLPEVLSNDFTDYEETASLTSLQTGLLDTYVAPFPFTIMTLATPFITNGMAKIPNLRHSL